MGNYQFEGILFNHNHLTTKHQNNSFLGWSDPPEKYLSEIIRTTGAEPEWLRLEFLNFYVPIVRFLSL